MVGGSALGLRAPCGVLTAFALRGWPRACTRPSGLGSGQDTMAPLRAAPTDSPMTERESYWHHGRRCKRLAAAALPAAGAGWQQQTPCPGRGSPPARHTPWRAGPAVQACVCESVCVRVRAWSRWCAVCVCVCVSVVVLEGAGGGRGQGAGGEGGSCGPLAFCTGGQGDDPALAARACAGAVLRAAAGGRGRWATGRQRPRCRVEGWKCGGL